jgi:hypothetical protein
MKRFSFLQVAIALVLMVTAVSCTTMQGAEDEYYSTQSRRVAADRVYVNDPYRGTVVLERDPYTGRYYEVSSPYGMYDSRYDSRYDRRYGSRTNSGYYGRNNRTYRNNGSYQQQTPQQPTQEQIRAKQKDRDESRRKVLGN